MILTFQQKFFCIIIGIIAFNQIIPGYCIYKPTSLGLFLFGVGFLLHMTFLIQHQVYKKILFKRRILIYLFFLLCLSVFQYVYNSNFLLLSGIEFISFYAIVTFFSSNYKVKGFILSFFLLVATWLFFFALIEYIFYLLGIDYILAPYLERGEDSGQVYAQGLLNLYRLDTITPRFQGLFKEPGHLGVCAGLLIFAWKKLNCFQRLVWTLSGILSLSLAFYILASVALLYNVVRLSICKSLMTMCGVAIIILIAYNGLFKDIADAMIINRVETYAEEGDNRSTGDFNSELVSMFDSSKWIYGYGAEHFFSSGYAWGNAGIKVDIYKYGCVGVIIILMMGFIMSSLIQTSTMKERFACFILFVMCYYSGDIKFGLYFWLILCFVFDKHIKKLTYRYYENSSNRSVCNQ